MNYARAAPLPLSSLLRNSNPYLLHPVYFVSPPRPDQESKVYFQSFFGVTFPSLCNLAFSQQNSTPCCQAKATCSNRKGYIRIPFNFRRLPKTAGPLLVSLRRQIKRSALCAIFLCLTIGSVSAATLTVRSTADAGGTCPGADCTLRQAIATAFAGDSINFALISNSVITLTSGQLTLNKSLTIAGPSSALLTVQRSSAAGTPNFRIFEVVGNAISLSISNMTLSNGSSADNGGGIYLVGGGSSNQGPTLTLTNVSVSGNAARAGSGGGIYKTAGGLSLVNCTVSGNSATADGGGIYNVGTGGDTGDLNLISTTITENSAGGNGGGLTTLIATSSQISNCTIARNSAGNDAGGIYAFQGQANTIDTIIALNTAPNDPDISGYFVSRGYNLIGNVSPGTNITGTTTGNQLNVNPLLGPLQDNGGLTKTLALLSGSPAIEGGNAGTFLTDQRGLARPVDDPLIGNASGGDGSDIGAYEAQADLLPGCRNINSIVTTNNDSGGGSLRDVIANVCQGVTVTFDPGVRGAINLASGELVIFKNVTIKGPGANLLAVQRSAAGGTPNFRVFDILGIFNAAISGLTIANGNNANLDNGGGIYNSATLSLTNVAISGNKSANAGGGIDNEGTLTLFNSTISGNTVGNPVRGVIGGGGIFNGGTANITNSTVSGNTVPSGNGGGIFSSASSLTLSNSTISANSASRGGGVSNSAASVQSKNTIIALEQRSERARFLRRPHLQRFQYYRQQLRSDHRPGAILRLHRRHCRSVESRSVTEQRWPHADARVAAGQRGHRPGKRQRYRA